MLKERAKLNCPAEYTQIKGVLTLLCALNFCVVKCPGATRCSTGTFQDKPRENYKTIASLSIGCSFLKSCWKKQQMLCIMLSGGRWTHLMCPHWFWCIIPAFCATNKNVIKRHLDFLTIVTCHMPHLKTGFCGLYVLSHLGNHGHFNVLILSHFPPGRFTSFPNVLCFSWLAAFAICLRSVEVSRREHQSLAMSQGPFSLSEGQMHSNVSTALSQQHL